MDQSEIAIDTLVIKARQELKEMTRAGRYIKLAMLPTLLYGCVEVFFISCKKLKHLPQFDQLVASSIITLVVFLFTSLLLLTIRSNLFISASDWNKYRNTYKNRIAEFFTLHIPEIETFCFYRFVPHSLLNKSRFFKTRYTDFVADDLFRGKTGKYTFQGSEMHAFNLFSTVFSGIFIVVDIPSEDIKPIPSLSECKAITNYKNKQYDELKISYSEDYLFFAFSHNNLLFEFEKPKNVEGLDDQLIWMQQVMSCVREAFEEITE